MADMIMICYYYIHQNYLETKGNSRNSTLIFTRKKTTKAVSKLSLTSLTTVFGHKYPGIYCLK